MDARRSISLWMATTGPIEASPLAEDASADTVVIGAGIAGLSTAYELARAGQSVIVLDRGAIGGGMTARTTAHLASFFDDYYHVHIRLRGLDEARQYRESQAAAIDRIDEIQAAESIDCDFARVNGYLFRAGETPAALLEDEFEACRAVGFTDVAWVASPPLGDADGSPCLMFPRQGRFHPLRYLAGLVRAIRRDGGRVHSGTTVVAVEEDRDGVTVSTEAGRTVRARAAVVATNAPINDRLAIHSKQAPYRTYVITMPVARGAVTDALFWNTRVPYHYVRLQPDRSGDEDWLIVGGEDHKTGEAADVEDRFARLVAWTWERFPAAGRLVHRWSGQVMEPVDNAPFVGPNPGNERIYIVTGDSGEGMTTGAAAGLMLRDMILGHPNPWAPAYAPRRKTLRAAGEFLRENTTVAVELARRVTGGDVRSLEALANGEGGVVSRGLEKIAAYRDERGALHLHTAVCSHAGCTLRWNAFEGTWDCPCHGSQFSYDGEPVSGPAIHALARATGGDT